MSEPVSTPPIGSPPGGPPSTPPPGGPPAGRPGLPWERAKGLGELVETAKLLITSPGEAFQQARERGDYGSPLLFFLVFAVVGSIISAFWSLVMRGAGMGPSMSQMEEMMGDVPPEMRGWIEMAMQSAQPSAGGLVLGILFQVVYFIILLFVLAVVIHLALSLFGGLRASGAGFEGTFRAVAYSSIAYLAYVIPVVGFLVALVWALVIQVIAFTRLHKSSQGVAVVGALSPYLLCCICCLALFALSLAGIGFGASMLEGMGN